MDIKDINNSHNINTLFDIIDLSGDVLKTNLPGKFLIATPYSKLNDMFDKSIIYILGHSSQGAVGVIINRLVNKIPFNKIIELLKNTELNEDEIKNQYATISLYSGGPVETERGLVLHTNDYKSNSLLGTAANFSVSSNLEVLRDLLIDKGPKKSLFIMGYTLWEGGQLEKEIQNNFWNVANSCEEIIFMENNNSKWQKVTSLLSGNNSVFSPSIGRG